MLRMAMILVVMGFIGGCASLESVDREQLNHPAMDLSRSQTPALQYVYTQMDAKAGASASGGCTVCAH